MSAAGPPRLSPPSTRPGSAGPSGAAVPLLTGRFSEQLTCFLRGVHTLGDLSSRALCTTFLLRPAVRFGRCLVGHPVTS